MRLAAMDGEHRAAVEYAMRPGLDDQARRVADEVVSRCAEERKLVLEETKPFLDRYQERAELVAFKTSLQALLRTVRGADVDVRAMELMEVLR